MELWLMLLLIVLVFGCTRKANTGRRCDLGFVVVLLSLVLAVSQLKP